MKLIAETAWHHDGDFEFFLNLVEAICLQTKSDYVKYHITLDVDEYMSKDHPAYSWAKERVFSIQQWEEVFFNTKAHGKKLMLLFNDRKAIEFGMQFNPELVEIHSVCLNDIKLLESLKNNIENKSTKIVLGVGGTDLYEIEHAIDFLDSQNIVMMHGFQNYPTKYEDINFLKMKKIMDLYPEFDHGYADHTIWNHENNVFITIMGAALGMHFVEKHVTTQPGVERTDWQAAVSIERFIEIQDKMEVLKEANGNGLLKMNEGEQSYSTYGVMKKAAILNADVNKGETLTLEKIDFKRTGQSSDLSQHDVLKKLGGVFSRDLDKGQTINLNDFQ